MTGTNLRDVRGAEQFNLLVSKRDRMVSIYRPGGDRCTCSGPLRLMAAWSSPSPRTQANPSMCTCLVRAAVCGCSRSTEGRCAVADVSGGRPNPELPQWMSDCVDSYMRTEKRPPTTRELLVWKEAGASCRMERES